MATLVARKGRELQRYTSDGHRLVVGCIPYRVKADNLSENSIQVLVISSQKGRDVMFPRGGWESDESKIAAARREAMEEAGVQGDVEEELGEWWFHSKSGDSRKLGTVFPLSVTAELLLWPEMANRKRRWLTLPEARETRLQQWMKEALERLAHRLSRLARERAPAIPGPVTRQYRRRELAERRIAPPAGGPAEARAAAAAVSANREEPASINELCSTAPPAADTDGKPSAGKDGAEGRCFARLAAAGASFARSPWPLSWRCCVWLWASDGGGGGEAPHTALVVVLLGISVPSPPIPKKISLL